MVQYVHYLCVKFLPNRETLRRGNMERRWIGEDTANERERNGAVDGKNGREGSE